MYLYKIVHIITSVWSPSTNDLYFDFTGELQVACVHGTRPASCLTFNTISDTATKGACNSTKMIIFCQKFSTQIYQGKAQIAVIFYTPTKRGNYSSSLMVDQVPTLAHTFDNLINWINDNDSSDTDRDRHRAWAYTRFTYRGGRARRYSLLERGAFFGGFFSFISEISGNMVGLACPKYYSDARELLEKKNSNERCTWID